MKKINIVKKTQDFTRIIKTKKAYVSNSFVIYIERKNQPTYHFGISVSKKIGNAVTRNKLKRQIKSIIDKKDYQNNFNCIIILRKGILSKSFKQKEIELYKELDNINNNYFISTNRMYQTTKRC